jgi:hypothetical protein
MHGDGGNVKAVGEDMETEDVKHVILHASLGQLQVGR